MVSAGESEGPRLPWRLFGLWQGLREQERGRQGEWKRLARLLKKSLILVGSLSKYHDLVTISCLMRNFLIALGLFC